MFNVSAGAADRDERSPLDVVMTSFMHSRSQRFELEMRNIPAGVDIVVASSSSLQDQSDRQRGTLGLAQLRRVQWRIEEAVALLTPVIDQQPQKPEWILPTFLIERAGYRMLLNDPAAGDDAARVLADRRWTKFRDPARETRAQIAKWRAQSADAAIYTSLLPANRLVVEDQWDEARAAYARVDAAASGRLAGSLSTGVSRLRARTVRRGRKGARADYRHVTGNTDWLRANALLTLAWTHDIAGRREAALAIYRRIVDDYGEESASGPARLGILAPYKRH